MTIGTKVNGTYFGVKYSGVVKGFWGWSDNFGRDGDDSIFVQLDTPIVFNGVKREGLSIKSNTGTIFESN